MGQRQSIWIGSIMTNNIQIYDHITGETIIREMTAEESARRDAEIAEWKATKEAKELAEAETVAAKATAEAKLAALGLTADDLKALGLGGN